MEKQNSIRISDTITSNSTQNLVEITFYLLPIIYILIDKVTDFAIGVMDRGYDLNVKAGPVDIALTKS